MHSFVRQRYINRIFWCEKFLVDIDINLDNETRAGFQTLGHFPWFSWRSKGRNCLGVEQKSQIQSLGISRHSLSWWSGRPITPVPLPFSVSMSRSLRNLSKQIVASLGVKKDTAWQVLHDLVVNDWTRLTPFTSISSTPFAKGCQAITSSSLQQRMFWKRVVNEAWTNAQHLFGSCRELCQLKHVLYKHLYSIVCNYEIFHRILEDIRQDFMCFFFPEDFSPWLVVRFETSKTSGANPRRWVWHLRPLATLSMEEMLLKTPGMYETV